MEQTLRAPLGTHTTEAMDKVFKMAKNIAAETGKVMLLAGGYALLYGVVYLLNMREYLL